MKNTGFYDLNLGCSMQKIDWISIIVINVFLTIASLVQTKPILLKYFGYFVWISICKDEFKQLKTGIISLLYAR